MTVAKKASTNTRNVKKSVKKSNKTTPKKTSKPLKTKKTTVKNKKKIKKLIKPSRKNTLQNSQPLSLPRSISVFTLFLKSGFPEKFDIYAIRTARFCGMFFVVVGALFSIVHITNLPQIINLSEETSLLAQTCSSDDCKKTISSVKPDASFTIKKGTLSGKVNMTVSVKEAKTIKIMAYNQESASSISLGVAVRKDDDIWTYTWDTSKFKDGNYVIEAIVNNEYGAYSVINSKVSSVKNFSQSKINKDHISAIPNTRTIPIAKKTTKKVSGDSVVSPVPVKLPSILPDSKAVLNFSFDSDKNNLSASVKDDSITKVSYYLGTNLTDKKFIGEALYDGKQLSWVINYDTSQQKAGNYVIYADITYKNHTATSLHSDTLKITNTIESTLITYVEKKPADVEKIPTTLSNEKVTERQILPVDSIEQINLEPPVEIVVLKSDKLQRIIDVKIKVKDANSIELYSTSKQSLTSRYIGTARRLDQDNWFVIFDTRNNPNGKYDLYVSVVNKYGSYKSSVKKVIISNPVLSKLHSEEEKKHIINLEEVGNEIALESKNDTQNLDSSSLDVEIGDAMIATEKHLDEVTNIGVTSEISQSQVEEKDKLKKEKQIREKLIENNSTNSDSINRVYVIFDSEYQQLTTAVRSGNEKEIENSKKRLDQLQKEVELKGFDEEILANLSKNVEKSIEKAKHDVERTNKIIEERTNKAASTDSDKDGIPDFDEVTIYNTDPYTADTDGDGFNDGAEVLNGFNPTDPVAEAVVVFASPKETGIVREDLLRINDIVTSDITDEKPIRETFISGMALPNSFVTLYIYSVPTIVTVKTESDGSFIYKFDKELDDGTHEVYVGVTDNAGQIVAKSKPFRFVKEAQAFTPVDAANEVTTTSSEGNLFVTGQLLVILLSFAVVTIGIILILVGLYLDSLLKKRIIPVKLHESNT